MVEGQFILRNITQDNLRFYYLLGALPESAVRGLGDLMRGPPPPDAYQQLKTRLLATHTLTEFQRMDKLLSAQLLGGQKLSDLLHGLQFCSEGEWQSKIFRYLFLQRFPAELRIILSGDVDSTLPVLAARADQLWAHSARRPHDAAAAVNAIAEDSSQEETTVAAVAGQTFGQGSGRGKPRGGHGGAARGGRGSNAAVGPGSAAGADKNSPTWLAKQASGLCRHHWRYGDKAFNCRQPCSWQGN
jgi:hypothetical protein